MIKKLSPKQEALISEVREEYLKKLFGEWQPIDKEAATKGIHWMYRTADLGEPEVIFTESPMAAQIEANRIMGTQNQYYSFSSYGNISDYSWLAHYDYFRRIGVKGLDLIQPMLDLINSGIYDCIQFETVCIVCGKPKRIVRDEEQRLHNDMGPAIEWGDGYSLYFWKGTEVPEKLIMAPETLTAKEVRESYDNVETRQRYIEILGAEKYFTLMGKESMIEILDRDIDHQGHPMTLVEFEFEGERFKVLEVIDPSTKKLYCISPPNKDAKTVWEAKASTFDDQQLSYRQGDVGLVNVDQDNRPEKPYQET